MLSQCLHPFLNFCMRISYVSGDTERESNGDIKSQKIEKTFMHIEGNLRDLSDSIRCH